MWPADLPAWQSPAVPDATENSYIRCPHQPPARSTKSGSIRCCYDCGLVLLNGVPVHWRSNRQPSTSLSPAESEVYALSVGVKDSRLAGWVLEELGVSVQWPMQVETDSSGAISFKNDTCPTSKLRGAFDYREDWVQELKGTNEVKVSHVSDTNNLADMFTKPYQTYLYVARVEQMQRQSGVSSV